VTAHHSLALYLLTAGRFTDALAESDRARQLDPFSFPVTFLRGAIFISLHEYARAAEQFAAAAALNPREPGSDDALALIYWIERRVPEALSEERKAAVLAASQEQLRDLDEVAAVYAKSGVPAALLRFAQLKERTYHGDDDEAYDIATRYGIAGDKEKVLEWLNRASGKGATWFMLRTPAFDFMRADPRFQDLLRRIGLPQ